MTATLTINTPTEEFEQDIEINDRYIYVGNIINDIKEKHPDATSIVLVIPFDNEPISTPSAKSDENC